MKIQGIANGIDLVILRQVHMNRLRQGMHARIGTSGGGHVDAMLAKAEYGVFQSLLNGRPAGLALPTDEARAVILDG